MKNDAVDYRISLEFWGSDVVVLTLGPLQIASMSKVDASWGSFEILWSDKVYFYCHFFEDCDPYNSKWDGTGYPEWLLEKLGQKTLWTSLQWFEPLQARFNRWVSRLHGS